MEAELWTKIALLDCCTCVNFNKKCHPYQGKFECKNMMPEITNLSDKERIEFVQGRFLECIKPITNVRKGNGCEVGHTYWFEYVHDTNDGKNPDAPSFYRKLSDNNHYDEVYITDEELVFNFKE